MNCEPLEYLEFMLNELYENRVLYKDSGLWQIRSDDMKEILYQQGASENFYNFIERCFNIENKILSANKNGNP